MNAGRQLGLDVVAGDQGQELFLVGHRLVDGVAVRRKTLQIADGAAVARGWLAARCSENQLRIAEYDC